MTQVESRVSNKKMNEAGSIGDIFEYQELDGSDGFLIMLTENVFDLHDPRGVVIDNTNCIYSIGHSDRWTIGYFKKWHGKLTLEA